MECYACDNQATRQCRRCSRVYCELHGDDLCAECLHPASALPSFNLYRGSLLTLLVGTAIALWLLVRPPGQGGGEEITIAQLTPTSVASPAVATPSTPTASEQGTPGPSATVTPGAAATTTPQTYTVQEGDTLFDIAQRYAPPDVELFEYAAQIAILNGIGEGDDISVGQTLVLP